MDETACDWIIVAADRFGACAGWRSKPDADAGIPDIDMAASGGT